MFNIGAISHYCSMLRLIALILSQDISVLSSFTASYNPQKCINGTDFDIATPIFPEQTGPEGESRPQFLLSYDGSRKYLTICEGPCLSGASDKQGNNNVNHIPCTKNDSGEGYSENNRITYLLYQCGTVLSKCEQRRYKDNQRIEIPVKSLVLSSLSQIPYIEQSGLLDKVKGIINEPVRGLERPPTEIVSPCLKEFITKDETAKQWQSHSHYLQDHSDGDLILGKWPDRLKFLKPSYYKVVDFRPQFETDPRAIVEWFRVIGALFNIEKGSNNIVNSKLDRISCTKTKLRTGIRRGGKLKVAWGYFKKRKNVFGNVVSVGWVVPAVGACTQNNPQWYCYAVNSFEARVDLLIPGAEGSIMNDGDSYLDDKEFWKYASHAHLFIYAAPNWSEVYDVKKKRLIGINGRIIQKEFKFLKYKKVYDNALRGKNNAWAEELYGNIDTIMADIRSATSNNRMLMGEELIGHQRVYLRNVFYDDESTASDAGTCKTSTQYTCKNSNRFTFRFEGKWRKCDFIETVQDLNRRRIVCNTVVNTRIKHVSGMRRIVTGCKSSCRLCSEPGVCSV